MRSDCGQDEDLPVRIYDINKGGKSLSLQGMIFEQFEIIQRAGNTLSNLIKMQEEQKSKEKEPETTVKIVIPRNLADN